ncbi:MAG: DNA repair protein RadA [Bdellovibrionales bacterium]
MAKSKTKTIFVCQSCGAQRPRWEGRCTECSSWNSFVEETFTEPAAGGRSLQTKSSSQAVYTINAVPDDHSPKERLSSKISELDRVLGGGLVRGSFVLLGGEPGIGKSTLILQMAEGLAKEGAKVLYLSAEESVAQTSQRARRLGTLQSELQIGSENNLEHILDIARSKKPDVLVVDSIQTVFLPTITSAPGSVSQVRECAGHLMTFAKSENISVIVIGHVTKDGNLAGPKVLEHLVDTVLSFEGDSHHHFRILRALKNRFGATHELGIFQMASSGLKEVPNPSELFLEERQEAAIGSVVFASIEGSRPLLCEVQALTIKSPMPMPRRNSIGLEVNRTHLLIAVLDRHGGLHLSQSDVFVNVVGGLKLMEPAADLAVAAALISSEKGLPVDPQSCYFGEIGLSGEVRAVPFADLRIKEAAKLGFSKFYLPASNRKRLFDVPQNLVDKIIWVKNIGQLTAGLKSPKTNSSSRPPEVSV